MDYFSRKVKTLVSSIQSLFTKTNSIRNKHKGRPDVSGLTTEFDTPNSLKQKSKSKTEVITSVKEDLNTLITKIPNTSSAAKTAYNKITIPDVKDLLKASDFNYIIDTINALDEVCVDCNNCPSHYGSNCADCGSDHGNFGHHTNHGDNSPKHSNYGDSGYTGHHSSDHASDGGSCISNYGSHMLSGR